MYHWASGMQQAFGMHLSSSCWCPFQRRQAHWQQQNRWQKGVSQRWRASVLNNRSPATSLSIVGLLWSHKIIACLMIDAVAGTSSPCCTTFATHRLS